MKLFKKITNPEKVKSFISVFIVFFSINNLIVFGSDNKFNFTKNSNIHNEFEDKFSINKPTSVSTSIFFLTKL